MASRHLVVHLLLHGNKSSGIISRSFSRLGKSRSGNRLFPAIFSVAASEVPADVYVPWHTTTGTPTAGVVGAVAGEDRGGLPLPAEIFRLARSLGMEGLPL